MAIIGRLRGILLSEELLVCLFDLQKGLLLLFVLIEKLLHFIRKCLVMQVKLLRRRLIRLRRLYLGWTGWSTLLSDVFLIFRRVKARNPQKPLTFRTFIHAEFNQGPSNDFLKGLLDASQASTQISYYSELPHFEVIKLSLVRDSHLHYSLRNVSVFTCPFLLISKVPL